jgi:hypothetical protein
MLTLKIKIENADGIALCEGNQRKGKASRFLMLR